MHFKPLTNIGGVLLFWLPVCYLVFFAALRFYWRDVYLQILEEDNILETCQFVFYAAASLGSLIVMRMLWRQRHRWFACLYALLAFGLFFIAGEEISWGQRIAGFGTPDTLRKINSQREFTLHNIYSLYFYLLNAWIIVGAYGTFGALLHRTIRRFRRDVAEFLIPSVGYVFYFLPLLTYYSYLRFSGYLAVVFDSKDWHIGRAVGWGDQEPAEFLFSLGVCIFVFTRLWRLTAPTRLVRFGANR